MIPSARIGPILHFPVVLMPVFIKNFFASMLFFIYTKGQLNSNIYARQRDLTQSLNWVKFSWRGRNRCYEVATTKPRYKSYRESIENHRKESSERKSSKYWWFMGFPEKEWESITTTFCKKLIGSYDWICNEVIYCKGKLIKYWIFLCLYIDLTRIYDVFLNFWPEKMYIFIF